MSTITISRKCGHKEEVYFKDMPPGELAHAMAMAKERLCKACYHSSKKQEGVERATEFEEAHPDLPELTGTQNQVDWGRSLRANVLQDLYDLRNSIRERCTNVPWGGELDLLLQTLTDNVEAQTEAKWWISSNREIVGAICRTVLGSVLSLVNQNSGAAKQPRKKVVTKANPPSSQEDGADEIPG